MYLMFRDTGENFGLIDWSGQDDFSKSYWPYVGYSRGPILQEAIKTQEVQFGWFDDRACFCVPCKEDVWVFFSSGQGGKVDYFAS